MKQALTAGGLISVWFESAKIAFDKMGIDYEEDLELPGLKGVHPEYGSVAIDFFVPVEGKTRMEISVQDAALISGFKENVVPAFRYVSELAAQEPKPDTEAEEAESEVPQEADAETGEQEEDVQAETETDETEAVDSDAESPSETDILPDPDTEDEVKAEPEAAAIAAIASDAVDPAKVSDVIAEREAPTNPVSPKVRYCKHCQAPLQEGQGSCPVCGKKQKGKGGLIAGIIIGIILLIALAGFAAYTYFGKQIFSITKIKALITGDGTVAEMTVTETGATTEPVSLNQFKSVQMGMTYSDVCGIMGGEGQFLEPEVTLTYTNGDTVVLKTYYWTGQGSSGANVCVSFRNGVVDAVTQTGLQ